VSFSPPLAAAWAPAVRATSWTRAANVPALALPVLFLHLRYQPQVHFELASTSVGIELSDVAVLVVAVAAAIVGFREGWAPLRPALGLWLAGGAFLALVFTRTFTTTYAGDDVLAHAVTAAKFCEYALLAVALPLLLRRRGEVRPLLWSLALVSAGATAWALLQFAGVVDEFAGRRPLQREPSFVGIHDFAALSGAAFATAVCALVARRREDLRLAAVAGVAGLLGLVLAGAAAAIVGVAAALLAIAVLASAQRVVGRRVVAGAAAAVVLAAAGIGVLRGGEFARTARAFGIGAHARASKGVQSYEERSVLAYIGVRIFLAHPLVGVGWEGSAEAASYGPELPAAHRAFPNTAPIAFPSPAHPWGVQDAYLQTLADLGVAGALALIALAVATGVLGVRAVRRAPGLDVARAAGLLWVLVAAGVWGALGLVAGIPLDALTCLGLGLVAATAAWAAELEPPR